VSDLLVMSHCLLGTDRPPSRKIPCLSSASPLTLLAPRCILSAAPVHLPKISCQSNLAEKVKLQSCKPVSLSTGKTRPVSSACQYLWCRD